MILTGYDIVREAYDNGVEKPNIVISPFDENKLNPNSYNLTLNDTLVCYKNDILDMAKDEPSSEIKIPESGLLLRPGILYLGRTNEYTETRNYVPMLEGRSSLGRLGVYIHVTAGFGDIGFCGYWTLEISVVQQIIIYPNIDVCQIYYHSINPDFEGHSYVEYGKINKNGIGGKYQNNTGIQTSQLWKELQAKWYENE